MFRVTHQICRLFLHMSLLTRARGSPMCPLLVLVRAYTVKARCECAGARLHCQGARGTSKNTETPQHDVPLYDLNTYMCIILSCALCLCKSYKQIIRTPRLAMNCKKLKDTTDYVSGHLPNCVPLLAPSQLRHPLRRQMCPCQEFAAPSSGKRKRHPCVERWRERAGGERERERESGRERTT